MPFFIDGEEYFEEITLSQKEFYERLKANHDVKTSSRARRRDGNVGQVFGRV